MSHPRPPKKRDRNADGWQLIGFYMVTNGVVTLNDGQIAGTLRPSWLTAHGTPDGERVRMIRAHVNKKSRREYELGVVGADRVFSGWSFSYRDNRKGPSILEEVGSGAPYDPIKGAAATLGDHLRFKQQDSERERIVGHAREAARAAVALGYINLPLAWLEYAQEIETFGQPRDVTVEKLRQLIANPS